MILSNNRTLLEDILEARRKGFTTDFLFMGGRLVERETYRSWNAEDFRIVETCRHEGMSDPGDASILFLIETRDGRKGFLSSPYGIYADERLMDFMLDSRRSRNQINSRKSWHSAA